MKERPIIFTELIREIWKRYRTWFYGLFWVGFLFLAYMDHNYWYSFMSYSHVGRWTDCKVTRIGEWERFTCREGEIELREAAKP